MMRLFFAVVVAFFWGAVFANSLPELPDFPKQILTKIQIGQALSEDSEETWQTLAQSLKQKALGEAKADKFDDAAGNLYAGMLADVFAKNAADMPKELKRILLENMPAFFDFYETLAETDSVGEALSVLSKIYANQPAQTKKYLRAAMALSLVYDTALPSDWPNCDVPDEPAQIANAQEVFLYFTMRGGKLAFDMSKMTVGELVFMTAVAGPVSELELVAEDNFSPTKIENAVNAVRLDARGGKKKWEEKSFTLENLRKLGGTQHERVYYAWRVANANGVPCLFFHENSKNSTHTWLAYMAEGGTWRTDVFRDRAAKSGFGAPLNPQTWKPVSDFDMRRLQKRETVSKTSAESIVSARLANAFLEAGDFKNACAFAQKAVDLDPENWRAYPVLISASARSGASSSEIDALYMQSIRAFEKYPLQAVKMLNHYRANLVARRRAQEADAMFMAAVKPHFRTRPAEALIMFDGVFLDMVSRQKNNAGVFSLFNSVLRSSSKVPEQFAEYIAIPLAKYFWDKGDSKSAVKVLKLAENAARSSKKTGEKLEQMRADYEAELKSQHAKKKTDL